MAPRRETGGAGGSFRPAARPLEEYILRGCIPQTRVLGGAAFLGKEPAGRRRNRFDKARAHRRWRPGRCGADRAAEGEWSAGCAGRPVANGEWASKRASEERRFAHGLLAARRLDSSADTSRLVARRKVRRAALVDAHRRHHRYRGRAFWLHPHGACFRAFLRRPIRLARQTAATLWLTARCSPSDASSFDTSRRPTAPLSQRIPSNPW